MANRPRPTFKWSDPKDHHITRRLQAEASLSISQFATQVGLSIHALRTITHTIRGTPIYMRPSALATCGRWAIGGAVIGGSISYFYPSLWLLEPEGGNGVSVASMIKEANWRGSAYWDIGGLVGGAALTWRRALVRDATIPIRLLRLVGGMGMGTTVASMGFPVWEKSRSW